ncbi:Gldg family protein [Pigmentibacter sp. JX0631]|uniref:Gldg family protein n=1 Tax=Pigmentibacter sp. JX0631 TaxID=2976982 RepID=UPI002469B414|nr:Gldg family protein [Pigmentibacter sp. JX0631]WGL60924.1 Gldg family protein [Pigmentibacter sp. JX0631]
MKKHKLEFSIGALFVALIVVLMWQYLYFISKPLPIILVSISVAIIIYIVSPIGEKNKEHEAYAPKFFAQAAVTSLIAVAIIILVAVILNKTTFSKTFDLTNNKINSLSDESEKLLDSLSKPVQIYCIPASNPTDNYCDNSTDLLNLYMRRSKNLMYMGALSLSDKAIIQKLQPSGYSRLMLLTDNNKSEVEGQITESKLTNGIINLIKYKKVVYFLTGHGEPSISSEGNAEKNYSDIVMSLRSRAYDVKEWNIKQGNLPKEARVLVAGDNNITYSEQVENLLENFIAQGGRLVLIVNPYREQGLEKLYAKLNLKLDPILLTLNTNTPIGQQIMKQNLSRPPVIASNFSTESPITKVITQSFGAQGVMPIDGARPITILNESGNSNIKTHSIVLTSAYNAAPITITAEARNKIDLNSPFQLIPDNNFDPNKAWPLAVSVDISGASNFSSDKSIAKPADAAKDKSEVVVYGFGIVSPFSKSVPISEEMLPLTIAHLYQDQELVSIPTKDFTPKQFNLSRNPALWLILFSGVLPISTALAGFFIWMRRRSA